MRDHERRVNVAGFDLGKQEFRVALHVGLAGGKGQRVVHHRTQWNFIRGADVNAGNRYRPAFAAAKDCLL